VPVDLDKSLSSKFETRLKEAFDLSDVRLHVTVDPDVIAGAVVRIGDQLIDGSAAGKLRQISKQVG
jgi:F-type H+-transporting ATPase subunit delta